MMKIAFLTTIFPMPESYLYDFFYSIERQIYKEFDIVIVNDGYEYFDKIKREFSALSIIELKYSSTPAKNREIGINYIKNQVYDVLIFGDSDDYFEENRVQVSIEKLNRYDIVVNDISLFDSDGIFNDKYILNRISNNSKLDIEFIKDKNIFGMSNTAINTKILEKVKFDSNLIAVDWYFFSCLLLRGCKTIFTADTVTFYRQYDNNTVGIKNITKELILKGIDVKLIHYRLLKTKYEQFDVFCSDVEKLKEYAENDEYIHELKKQNIDYPLWWEEIRTI